MLRHFFLPVFWHRSAEVGFHGMDQPLAVRAVPQNGLGQIQRVGHGFEGPVAGEPAVCIGLEVAALVQPGGVVRKGTLVDFPAAFSARENQGSMAVYAVGVDEVAPLFLGDGRGQDLPGLEVRHQTQAHRFLVRA